MSTLILNILLNKLKKQSLKKYYREFHKIYPNEYLEKLKKEIINSPYLAKNHLNYRFSTTLGYSVIFKKSTINKAKEKFPVFEKFIDQIAEPDINAFYLNPLVLGLDSKVERHIDLSLRTYYEEISFPQKVAVLYIDIPKMEGGNLVLYKNDKYLTEIIPEKNKLIIFRGELKHEIETISEIFSQDCQQRISLVCELYSLDNRVLSHIPDFLIRSDTAFDNFLKMEI